MKKPRATHNLSSSTKDRDWGRPSRRLIAAVQAAIQDQAVAVKQLRTLEPVTVGVMVPYVVGELQLLSRMLDQIAVAFAGQPILITEPPTSYKNRRRFTMWVALWTAVLKLQHSLVTQYCRLLRPNSAELTLLQDAAKHWVESAESQAKLTRR
jgi:hypothetical protein